MQVFEEKLPKLSIEETQEEQGRALLIVPKEKQNNYPFGFWVPTKHYEEKQGEILPSNGLLVSFAMLAKSRECVNCGKMILPIPTKNMLLPESCKFCGFNAKKSIKTEKKDDFKRSSTLTKLDSLLTEAFKNYYAHADFERKPDYSENWHHEENHETYMKYGIVKEALEIKTLISSLITYDGFSIRYFTKDGKTYKTMFDEIVENDSILKLEPYYNLLTMATSVIKAPQVMVKPSIRYPRTSPKNVINSDQMAKRPNVEQNNFN